MGADLLLVLTVTFFAGGIQRVTGMGSALVATPVLVVVYGADEGVRLAVLLGAAISLGLLANLWRHVNWRTVWRLTWPGLLVSPVAALAVFLLPEFALLLLVAVTAASSLLASRSVGLSRVMAGRGASVKAGISAGFLNLTSGLSGPPLLGFAIAERMPTLVFVASAQAVFVALDLVTLAWRGMPTVPLFDLSWLLLAVLVGLVTASATARFIPIRVARFAMFAIAWAGTVAVLVKGLIAFSLLL